MKKLALWRSWFCSNRSSSAARPSRRSVRPRMEELERRELPATGLTAPIYPSAHGAYSLGIPDMATPANVLSNRAIDGVALRVSWKNLEPSDGVFNWSFLDGQVAAAAAAGKKVNLAVMTGVAAPAWVYADGARSFTFVTANSPASNTIPLPWDPVYLTKWRQFVTAFGARYNSNPAVAFVKVTGISALTEEALLPTATGSTTTQGSQAWRTTNDVANWKAAGYTRTVIENAWRSIADSFSQAFPAKRIDLTIVPSGLPPIDAKGNIIPNNSGDPQATTDLINQGIAAYASQFMVQNNGLSANWISADVTAASGRVATGYQMLWFVSNDPTYRMNGGKPVAGMSALQSAINKGLSGGAQFLEVYQADVLNSTLGSVLTSAHSSLGGAASAAAMVAALASPSGSPSTASNSTPAPSAPAVTPSIPPPSSGSASAPKPASTSSTGAHSLPSALSVSALPPGLLPSDWLK